MNKQTKIAMIAMFKNEASVIERMLESCYKHIDYYVMQDNGSTDGTTDIVREFFNDKNIPGFIYEVEEGWISFGWNRDHLLQTCLKTDHGCDWILKMDCDEYLEVDDDFDWTPINDTNNQSFHITAMQPGCVYYRAWMWNARLPWHFKHDLAHECIVLDLPDANGDFQKFDLPKGFRQIGTNEGETYTVPTKYLSDALKLEEKHIREDDLLNDIYHFWYIGKSYYDCFTADFYPLGKNHSIEYARRSIFYFKEWLKHMNPQGIYEMAYYTHYLLGDIYKYLGEYETAIEWCINGEQFCPVRNEHIVCLAECYMEMRDYKSMKIHTQRLVDPNRKLPFPEYYFLVNNNFYIDTGKYPEYLHEIACDNVSYHSSLLAINKQSQKSVWVVDNFYSDPYAVRDYALKQEFKENIQYYKGRRTEQQHFVPGTKEAFERIMGIKIREWESHGMNGRFQYCVPEDPIVYHNDGQTWAAMIYLHPNPPYSCGTSFYASKNGAMRAGDENYESVFNGGFYDATKFELVDSIGNVFNRLVIFDAKHIHAASQYFGTNKEDSRLFQIFFFD